MIKRKMRKKCILCGTFKEDNKMHTVYAGVGVCKKCFENELETTPDKCFEGKGNVRFVMSAFLYDGAIKETVKKYKFSPFKIYGSVLGEIMCEEFENLALFEGYDMIVPVPLHINRKNERGFNQSVPLAKALSRYLGIPVRCDILKRIRETERQSSLRGRARIENVAGAFLANMPEVKGKNVILVDDIYTMGATLKACGEALSDAGCGDVIGASLCRATSKELKRLEIEIPLKSSE